MKLWSYLNIQTNSAYRRTVATVALCALFFNTVLSDLSYAQGAGDAPNPPLNTSGLNQVFNTTKELDLDNFVIPTYLGYVKDRYCAPEPIGSKRIVIHIQDAHCNYNAQHTISRTIDYLQKVYGVKTIGLEGGEGAYDVSAFANKISDPSIRENVADYFLKEGLIGGPEFYAVTNPGNVKLLGVENTDVYIENLGTYRNFVKDKDRLDRELLLIGHYLAQLKSKVYSEELLKFDAAKSYSRQNATGLKDNISRLKTVAASLGMDLSRYENINLLSTAFALEPNIDFKASTVERDWLIERLTKLLSKYEAGELVRNVVDFKAGRMQDSEFYAYLTAKADEVRLDLSGRENLRRYIKYMAVYASVKQEELFREIEALENEIEDRLCRNDEERALAKLARDLDLMRNIFSITLEPYKFDYWQSNKKDFDADLFLSFIKNVGGKYGLEVQGLPDAAAINAQLKAMERFYELSQKRDEEFVRRISKSLDDDPAVALVTGGFHGPNLARLLKNANISYVSILPNFRMDDAPSAYFKLLAGDRPQLLAFLSGSASTIALYTHQCPQTGRVYPAEERQGFAKLISAAADLVDEKKGVSNIETAQGMTTLTSKEGEGAEVGQIGGAKIYAETVIPEKSQPVITVTTGPLELNMNFPPAIKAASQGLLFELAMAGQDLYEDGEKFADLTMTIEMARRINPSIDITLSEDELKHADFRVLSRVVGLLNRHIFMPIGKCIYVVSPYAIPKPRQNEFPVFQGTIDDTSWTQMAYFGQPLWTVNFSWQENGPNISLYSSPAFSVANYVLVDQALKKTLSATYYDFMQRLRVSRNPYMTALKKWFVTRKIKRAQYINDIEYGFATQTELRLIKDKIFTGLKTGALIDGMDPKLIVGSIVKEDSLFGRYYMKAPDEAGMETVAILAASYSAHLGGIIGEMERLLWHGKDDSAYAAFLTFMATEFSLVAAGFDAPQSKLASFTFMFLKESGFSTSSDLLKYIVAGKIHPARRALMLLQGLYSRSFMTDAERSLYLSRSTSMSKEELTDYQRVYDTEGAADQLRQIKDQPNEEAPDMAELSALHIERNNFLRDEIRKGNVFRVTNTDLGPELYKRGFVQGVEDSNVAADTSIMGRIRTFLATRSMRQSVYERLKRIRSRGGALEKVAQAHPIRDLVQKLGMNPPDLRAQLFRIAQYVDILIVKRRFTLHENGPIAHARRGKSAHGTAIWLGERLFTSPDISDEDIANLIIEEAKHILAPDAAHTTIVHSKPLMDKLAVAARAIGESPADKLCEADMAEDANEVSPAQPTLDAAAVAAFNAELLEKSASRDLVEAKKEWALYRIEYLADGGHCRFGHFIRWRLTFKNNANGNLITDLGSEEVADTLGLTTAENVEQFKKDRKRWIERLEVMQLFRLLMSPDQRQALSALAHPNDSLALSEGQKVDEIFAQLEPTINEYQAIQETLPVLDRPRLVQKYLGSEARQIFLSIKRKLSGDAILEALSPREREVALGVRADLESAQTFLASNRRLWALSRTDAANEADQDLYMIENASFSNYYIADLYLERIRRGDFQVLDFGAGRSGFYSRVRELLGETPFPATSMVIDVDKEDSGIEEGINPNRVIIDASGMTIRAQPNELEDKPYYSQERYGTYDLVVSNFVMPHLTPEEIKDFLLLSFRILKPDGQVVIALPRNITPSDDFLKALGELGWDVAQNESARVKMSPDAVKEIANKEGRAVAREVKALVERDFHILILRKSRGFMDLSAHNVDAGLLTFNKGCVARHSASLPSIRSFPKLDFDHIDGMYLLADGLKLKDIMFKDPQTGEKIAPLPKDISEIALKWPSVKPDKQNTAFDIWMRNECLPVLEKSIGIISADGTRNLNDAVPEADGQVFLEDLKQIVRALGCDWDDMFGDVEGDIAKVPPIHRTLLAWQNYACDVFASLNREVLMERGWFLDAFKSANDSLILAVARVHAFDVVESGQEILTLAVLSNYYTDPQEKLFFGNKSTIFNAGNYMAFEYEMHEEESHLQKVWDDINDESLIGYSEMLSQVDEIMNAILLQKMRTGNMNIRMERSEIEERVRQANEPVRKLLRKTPSVLNIGRALRKLGFDRYKRVVKETAVFRGGKGLREQVIFNAARSKVYKSDPREEIGDIIFASFPKHPIVAKLKGWLLSEFPDDNQGRAAYLVALLTARQTIEPLLCAPSYEVFIEDLYETIYANTLIRKAKRLMGQDRALVNAAMLQSDQDGHIEFFVLYLIDRWAAKKFTKATVEDAKKVVNLEYLATCKPRELYDMLRASVASLPKQESPRVGKSGNNIGKFVEVVPVSVDASGVLQGVIEHIETKEKIDLANINQRRAPPEEVQSLIESVRNIASALPDSAQKRFVEQIIDMFAKEAPKDVIIMQGGDKGFFGMARPGLLVIDRDIAINPISVFHEMAEYVIQRKPEMINKISKLLDDRSKRWIGVHETKYRAEKRLSYFQKNFTHFMIRAFTRQVFGRMDEQMSSKIKLRQVAERGYRLQATRYRGKSVKDMRVEELDYFHEILGEMLKNQAAAVEMMEGEEEAAAFLQRAKDRRNQIEGDIKAIDEELKLREDTVANTLAGCLPKDARVTENDIDKLNMTMRSIFDFLAKGRQHGQPHMDIVYIRDCGNVSKIGIAEKRLIETSLRALCGSDAVGKIRPIEGKPINVVVQCAPADVIALGTNKTQEVARMLRENGYGLNAKSIIGMSDKLQKMIEKAIAEMGTDPDARTFIYLPVDLAGEYRDMMEQTPELADKRLRLQLIDAAVDLYPDLATRFMLGLKLLDFDRMSQEDKKKPPQELINLLAAVSDFNPTIFLQNLFVKGFILRIRKLNFKDHEEWKLAQDIVLRAL